MLEQKEVFETLEVKQIHEILPHRYPFLMVDRVTSFDKESKTMVAIKNVSMNEHFFQGHFPEAPVMPGVLILEAMAQAGGILSHLMGYGGNIAILLGAEGVKFRKKVVPGDRLEIQVRVMHLSRRGGRIAAKAMVEGMLVAEAEISSAFVAKEEL